MAGCAAILLSNRRYVPSSLAKSPSRCVGRRLMFDSIFGLRRLQASSACVML
jgi:hypothetical protein